MSLIIDFLGSYLFPEGERTIDDWVATGISLGGNLTWRLLQTGASPHPAPESSDYMHMRPPYASSACFALRLTAEPRITTAIPIIGLPWPSFPKYLRARAESMSLEWAPPLYPPSLRPVLETPPPAGVFREKNILSIHGGDDTLVPFSQGREDIEAIRREVEGSGGNMEVWVKEGAGHVVTGEMVRRVGEWIWRYSLAG